MNIRSGIGLTLLMSLASAAGAGERIECPKNTDQAHLYLEGAVSSTGEECVLLQDKELRKLVDKFAAGTEFAWPDDLGPDDLGTCFSGQFDGYLEYLEGNSFQVAASAASAQRLFPTPKWQDELGLSQDGVGLSAVSKDSLEPFGLPSLAAGAAMTALDMTIGEHTAVALVDDHFLSTELGDDTEDFLIVGSAGDLRLSGRLLGRGFLVPGNESLTIVFTEVSGNVCVATK